MFVILRKDGLPGRLEAVHFTASMTHVMRGCATERGGHVVRDHVVGGGKVSVAAEGGEAGLWGVSAVDASDACMMCERSIDVVLLPYA